MEKIAIIGLGYVGLPVALALAKKFPHTVGFDIDQSKVNSLVKGIDLSQAASEKDLQSTSLKITSDASHLKDITFFIVTVPTPVDKNNRPDLTPLIKASQFIGAVLQRGSVIVYESTVYPGVTEEICGPTLEKASGYRQGTDFKLGYSPERINPGDTEHTLERITKIISGEDSQTLERIAGVYDKIIDAGLYKASSIKIAEAAKVIENVQRDLNVALMNELAIICDRLNIPTREVLAAASTKWNFLRFTPGLVGGHCIGVDPYYLTTKAEELGYHPEVILAGRRINDSMGEFIAKRTIKSLIHAGVAIKGARVGILGITFKENVPDVRNSRVPDIVEALKEFGVDILIHDPMTHSAVTRKEYGMDLTELEKFQNLDGLILAVNHCLYLEMPSEKLISFLKPGGVFVDVKSCLDPKKMKSVDYWSL